MLKTPHFCFIIQPLNTKRNIKLVFSLNFLYDSLNICPIRFGFVNIMNKKHEKNTTKTLTHIKVLF